MTTHLIVIAAMIPASAVGIALGMGLRTLFDRLEDRYHQKQEKTERK